MKPNMDQDHQSDQQQDQEYEQKLREKRNQAADEVHHQHDTSYKFLLSSKKLFLEFLRSFVAKNWTKEITEEHVEQIPHSFVLQDFKQQEADIVYRVNLQGQDVLFYILVELQSTVDYRMPYRLLLYQAEIWRYWLNNQTDGMKNRKGFSLPPIVPIVLYNGKPKWKAKREFRQLLSNETMFASELLNFEYILIDVARYTEQEMLSLSNTLSAVFLLDQAKDQEQMLAYLRKLMGIIKELSDGDQQRFVTWMNNKLRSKVSKNEPIVAQLLKSVKGAETVMGFERVIGDMVQNSIQKGIEQGIEQGIQIGEDQALETIAKRMLAEKLDVATITKITGLPLEKIEQLRK